MAIPGSTSFTPISPVWTTDFATARGVSIEENIDSKSSLWNLTNDGSFYFGNASGNYDAGTAVKGQLITDVIDLTVDLSAAVSNPLRLAFDYQLKTEDQPGYDIARVYLQRQDASGNWPADTLTASPNNILMVGNKEIGSKQLVESLSWLNRSIALNALLPSIAGNSNAGKVRLVFDFDSVDNLSNNFLGWKVDNIRITRDVIPEPNAVVVTSIPPSAPTAQSVISIAPPAVGGNEQAVLLSRSGATGGQITRAPNSVVTITGDLSGYSLQRTYGSILGDSGEEILLVKDNGPSFLVNLFDSSLTTINLATVQDSASVKRNNFGRLVSMGDVDGDSVVDLGVSENVVTDASNAQLLRHSVGRIYSGAQIASSLGFTNPILSVETGLPQYVTSTSNAPELVFGPLGNVDGQGRYEFAIGDSDLGRNLHIFKGESFTNNTLATGGFTESSDIYRTELATPLVNNVSTPTVQTIPPSGTTSLSNATFHQGSAVNQNLRPARSLGDITGDGVSDFYFQGEGTSFIVFGPLDTSSSSSISDLADIVIDNSTLGIAAEGMGDINGDGINDLAFVSSRLTTVLGGQAFPREWAYSATGATVSIGGRPYANVGALPGSFSDGIGADLTAAFFDWDGVRSTDSQNRTKSEIIARGGSQTSIYRFNANGSLMASPSQVSTLPSNSSIAAVVDMNGDGRNEIFFFSSGTYYFLPGGALNVSVPSSMSGSLKALGDIDTTPDGYTDFALSSSGISTASVVIYKGAAGANAALPYGSIGATFSQSVPAGRSIVLTPSSGDFNGDGRADLAILERATSSSSGLQIGGNVYFFYDVGSRLTGGTASIEIGTADVILTSDGSNLINAISTTNSLDLDGDRISDLSIAATFAASTSGLAAAGRVYSLSGQRRQVALPTNTAILANRTITGSGDFLADRATGVPEVLAGKINENKTELWYKFATLGDGLPGNSLQLASLPDKPLAIPAIAAMSGPSFGADGSGTTETFVGTGTDGHVQVARQLDGKLVAVGYYTVGSKQVGYIARYDQGGTLDPSFGNNGLRVFDISNEINMLLDVVTQDDGKILVLGRTKNTGNSYRMVVARYLENGQLDSTFGSVSSPGLAVYGHGDFGLSTGDFYASRLRVQTDGRIVVSGHLVNAALYDTMLTRLTASGQIDPTFNSGQLVIKNNQAVDLAYGLAIQADGKIVQAGYSNEQAFFLRWKSDGTPDSTFGDNGSGMKVFQPTSASPGSGNSGGIRDITIQPDGKIVGRGM